MSAAPIVQDTARAHLQRRTLAVLVVMQIVGTVGVGVAPSIGILVAGDITQNEAWAGLARTASTLGAALMGVPLGTLAARRGRRFALASGWWTAAAGSALLVVAAQGRHVVPLFIGLFLMGAGLAVSLQARFAATDLAEPGRHGRSLALIVWVGTIGSVLGPNLAVPGRIVTDATGLTLYSSAFLIAAIGMTLAGTIAFVLLRPDPLLEAQRGTATPAAERSRGAIARMIDELRDNPGACYAVAAIVSAQIVMVAIMTMTPVHLTHQGGSVEIVGVTISLHIVGMYAFSPLVGQLTDRFGHRTTIFIGLLIFLVSLGPGAARPDGTGWIIGSLILLGLGWSFVNVAGSALFSSVVSDDTRASSQGGVDALSNLCGATAAFLAGPLLAATSFSTLSILAILALVPLGVLVLTRRPQMGQQTP